MCLRGVAVSGVTGADRSDGTWKSAQFLRLGGCSRLLDRYLFRRYLRKPTPTSPVLRRSRVEGSGFTRADPSLLTVLRSSLTAVSPAAHQHENSQDPTSYDACPGRWM